MPASAQKRYCKLGPDWFKPARKNKGVNELYLSNDTFDFHVMAVWNVTEKQMKQCLKHYKWRGRFNLLRSLPPGSAKCIFPVNGSPYYMFFTPGHGSTLNCIVHECMHVVVSEMLRRGIEPKSQAGDETWAYVMGWLVEQVVRKMKP